MTAPALAGRHLWVAGARPRTLPAAIVPVLVGTAAAADADLGTDRGLVLWRFLLALVVSLALQVGVNYANDYSDGIRGTDASRAGPLRLVGSGLVEPARVKLAAFASFTVAAGAGLGLAAATTWWLLAVGATAIAAAWFYTGGRRPYGYAGLGEVFVFVFFGLVATVGSTYVQTERIDPWPVVAAIPVGLLATALLVTNNVRDIPTDRAAAKLTLAVRLGDSRARLLYVSLVVAALAFVVLIGLGWRRPALLGLLGVLFLPRPVRTVLGGVRGADLIPVLSDTARLQVIVGTGLALGLFLGA